LKRTLLLALLIAACGEAAKHESNERDAGPDAFAPVFDATPPLDAGCVRREEVCNGRDDDCDGLVDGDDPDLARKLFGDPQNCGACGHACSAPHVTEAACTGGQCVAVSCEGGFVNYDGHFENGCESDCVVSAGGREVCDGADNDCDGNVDEDFHLDSDPAHCGACDHDCGHPPHAALACVDSACAIGTCEAGWVDLDGDPSTGCEYRCTVRATDQVREFCNGLDDDCDGKVDEAPDLAPPEEDFCGHTGACGFECGADADCAAGERCNGGHVCVPAAAGPADASCETDADCQALAPGFACLARIDVVDGAPVTTRRCVERQHGPMCDGAAGYRCVRSPAWQQGNEAGRCDGIDNDCDGRIDEDFAADLFVDGVGRTQPRACFAGEGTCRQDGHVVCTADGLGTECSAQALPAARADDPDCNGRDDDCDGRIDEDFEDAWVQVGGVQVYAYEASRPGATAQVEGLDLTPDDDTQAFVEARACSRPGVLPWANLTWAEADAACRAAGARLCRRDEWSAACGGHAYPYGDTYRADACNGGAYDTDPATAGDQDAALPTGSAAACVADGVYDLSGNLKEWTDDQVDGQRPVRGGGFGSNVPAGLACGELGDLKPGDFRSAQIGFRCCREP
jgi:hypothetical protein